jgi:hypothetical protein
MDSLPTDLSWNYDTLFSAFCFLLPVSLPFCVIRVILCQGNGKMRFPDYSPDSHSPDICPAFSMFHPSSLRLRRAALCSFSAKNRIYILTFISKCGSLDRMRAREPVKLSARRQAGGKPRENRTTNFIVKAGLLQTQDD